MHRGKFFENAFDGSDRVKDPAKDEEKTEAEASKKTQRPPVSFGGVDLNALSRKRKRAKGKGVGEKSDT